MVQGVANGDKMRTEKEKRKRQYKIKLYSERLTDTTLAKIRKDEKLKKKG